MRLQLHVHAPRTFCCCWRACVALTFVMTLCLGPGLYLTRLKTLGRDSVLSAPRLPEHDPFMSYCWLASCQGLSSCLSVGLVVLGFTYG